MPAYGNYSRLQLFGQGAAPTEVDFAEGATDCIIPYRTNRPYQLCTLLTVALAPFYFVYIWRQRRPDMPVFGTLFFLEEFVFFFMGLCSRVAMWFRQRRYVCRLDALQPPFPADQWPKVHIYFCHYAEAIEDSVKPLQFAIKQEYPPDRFTVTILDDGYYKRNNREGEYYVTPAGNEMREMISDQLGYLAAFSGGWVDVSTREVCPEMCRRIEPSPGGSTIIEFKARGLPTVRLVGRKKGPDSYLKTGNLENALWNVMEDDVPLMVLLDTDMAPEKDMLQYLLPPFFKLRVEGGWTFDWETAFVSSPQSFSNIERCFGTDDPLDQMHKHYFRELPAALDWMGLAHFWGTNAAFFAPALRASNGFMYGCIGEDTVTGASLHQCGWRSKFVGTANISLATGLSRETLTETCDQRKRWSQGNMQQFLMDYAPRRLMADRFRDAPYRQAYYHQIQRFKDLDSRGELPPRIAEGDTGVEARCSRRTALWALRREIAYFDTKFGFLQPVQPICFYAISLTISISCKGPFVFDIPPISFKNFFSSVWVVFAYWCVHALTHFLKNSYQITDPNNPNNTAWRDQQDAYAFAWIKLLGAWEGGKAVFTGRQPTWKAFGMAGGVNLVFELPVLLAFLGALGSIAAVVINWVIVRHGGDGASGLPGPQHYALPRVLGCQMMSLFVIINLWPVTSCIIADLLRVPTYTVRGCISALTACMVQVAASVLWVLTFYGEE